MKCIKCGAEIKDGSKFCTECGAHIETAEETVNETVNETESRQESETTVFSDGPGGFRGLLGDYAKVKYKLEYVDHNSKPMEIFCIVGMALMAIVTVVALAMNIFGVPILSIIVLLLCLGTFFINRKGPGKHIDFRINRSFPVLIGMMISMTIIALVASIMFKSGGLFDDDFFNDDTAVTEEAEPAEEEAAPAAEETAEDTAVTEGIAKTSNNVETYESEDGWKIDYNTDKFFLNDALGDGQICFNYLGESAGTNCVIISYVPDKMPDEVLYEKVEGVDDALITRDEGYFGGDNYWSHSRVVDSANTDPEAGDVVKSQYTAIEHNGGSVLLEFIVHPGTDEGQMMAMYDSLEALVGTFELVNHEPQTEYDYIPGTYVREYTEEIGGEDVDITDTIVLNDDHSCEGDFQDTITGTWTGTTIFWYNGNEEQFKVEGDSLYLQSDIDDTWTEFTRQ